MDNSKTLSNANFTALIIVLVGNHTKSTLDIGTISLHKDNRSYYQDITQSFRNYDEDEDTTTIECTLEYDEDDLKDIFEEDCNFDLTENDLKGTLDKAEVYFCSETVEFKHKSINLLVDIGETEHTHSLTVDR